MASPPRTSGTGRSSRASWSRRPWPSDEEQMKGRGGNGDGRHHGPIPISRCQEDPIRVFVGIIFILHGLAHAGAGMWSSGPQWVVTVAWWLATSSFMAAGFGLAGVPILRAGVRQHVIRGAVFSLVLLMFVPHVLLIPGVLLDVLFVAMVSSWQGVDASRAD